MSTKLKVAALFVLLLGLAALLALQQQQIRRLVAESADLRGRLTQMASLQDNNEGLARQLKAAIAASQTNQNELLRLRGQGARLRQLEQENVHLKAQRQQLDQRITRVASSTCGRMKSKFLSTTLRTAACGTSRSLRQFPRTRSWRLISGENGTIATTDTTTSTADVGNVGTDTS